MMNYLVSVSNGGVDVLDVHSCSNLIFQIFGLVAAFNVVLVKVALGIGKSRFWYLVVAFVVFDSSFCCY